MLQRYIGIAVLFTGILIVYFYSRTTFGGRFKRAVLLGLSLIPIGAWVLSISVKELERGGPSSFFENIYWFTVSALSWFFSYSTLLEHPVRMQIGLWAIWLLVIIFIILLLTLRRRGLGLTFTEIPILLFGLIYTIVLLAISSLSYFNRLDGRFVSPVYIPFVVLFLTAAETVLDLGFLKSTKTKIAGSVVMLSFLLLVLGLSTYQSVSLIKILKEEGSGYTSREWYNNKALKYWLLHQPEADHLAFSNYPAGVAIHGWQETWPSPRKTSPNAGVDGPVFPLDDYNSSLFEAGKESYLIWIEPNSYTHIYSVEELRSIANIETLYEDEDGGVYKLFPVK
jgi:hypothetical protein